MFKRIEAWLRRIISEEVSRVDVSLSREGEKIASAVSAHVQSCLQSIESEFTKLGGEFATKLRQDAATIAAEKQQLICELTTKFEALQATAAKLLPQPTRNVCPVDAETVQNDSKLKFRKD